MTLNLNAEPETIEADPERSAVVVIDMQNFDISPGGLFDLTGTNATHGKNVIEPIKKVWNARCPSRRYSVRDQRNAPVGVEVRNVACQVRSPA